MVRRLPGADSRGPIKFRVIVLLILTISMLWQGCSDNPVTPRKSVVGVWELISMKHDDEDVINGFGEIIAFNADSTGSSEVYLNGEILIPRQDIVWEIKGDSISISAAGGETVTHWYSCTNDRLTLKKHIGEHDSINELIYARLEEE